MAPDVIPNGTALALGRAPIVGKYHAVIHTEFIT